MASGVLTERHHTPSKGSSVYIEPCYEQFHKQLLQDLKQSPASSQTHRPGNSGGRGQSADPPGPAAAGSTSARPAVQPKQQSAPQPTPSQTPPQSPGLHPWNASSCRRQKKENSQSYSRANAFTDWQEESNYRDYRGRGRKNKHCLI